MRVPGFVRLSLLSATLLLASGVNAEIYKWVDENGQTHYTQQPPESGQAETIQVPPPPPIDDTAAEVEELIEQQEAAEKSAREAEQEQQQEAERLAAIQKNCEIAQANLKLYQDNPGRRMMDEAGNVYRLTEEERQQKIEESRQQIEEFCQQ